MKILAILLVVLALKNVLNSPVENISASKQGQPWTEQQQMQDRVKCQSLIDSGKAIKTTIHNIHPPMEFPMMLFPASIDKYISPKLMKNPITYENEVSNFIRNVLIEDKRLWAVDLGANIGYHSMFMASLGNNVIAFEPAFDTHQLFTCSLALNPTFKNRVTVIRAGASNIHSTGHLSRHPDSPGLTTFADTQKMTEGLGRVNFDVVESESDSTSIPMFPAQEILEKYGLPTDKKDLGLLKVDVEGFELQALQGLNLEKYPFSFLQMEFFPELIRASASDPLDLLELVTSKYNCIQKGNSVDFAKDPTNIGTTREELKAWADKVKGHTNLFCQRKD